MNRKTCLAWAVLAYAAPQFAQTPAEGLTPAQLSARAKAQNVPEIPFDSAPNFLKLPPNLYLGEGIGVATNSKGHIFVYTRSQATRLFEFDAKGNYLREIGEGLYGFVFAHAVRVDPQDNIWAVDEGTNMVIKFNPEGRVLMVLGRRPEPGRGPRPPHRRTIPLQSPHRRRLGRRGKHLRLRRLRQLARRQVRQERPLHRRRRQQGLRARPAESSPHHCHRCQGQRLRRRPQQQPHTGLRQRSQPSRPSTTRWARPGPSASRPARINISTAPIRIRTATTRSSPPSPARSTRWSWMEPSSASSGTPARNSASSATVHEIDCRNENELLVSEIIAWRVQKLSLHPERKPQ